jgi:hypothetical protein
MARIAKSDVHAALRRVADQIIDAGGDDKRISRADIAAKLATLDGIEKTLVDLFYRFLDHRDYRLGSTVTVRDVEDGYLYAIEQLIDAYDTNNNGLSRDEVARMSTIGKLAVAFAAELADQPEIADAPFDADFVEAELRELVDGLTVVSESLARLEPIVVPLAPSARLELDTVRLLFGDMHDELARAVVDHPRPRVFDLDDACAQERDFGAWFAERRMPDDLLDPLEVERAVRTGELVDYLTAHVIEPRVFAYTDPSARSPELAHELARAFDLGLEPDGSVPSLGLVSVFVLGRNPEGWVVGVFTSSIET